MQRVCSAFFRWESPRGMTVTLYADGQDEDAALEGLASLVGSGFSEN